MSGSRADEWDPCGFISVVRVDPWQMMMLIVVCVGGGWLGTAVVASLSRRAVQLSMGCALLVAAAFMMLGMLGQLPAGGTSLAFTSRGFALALVVNFVLGALLTLGIGNYAPSLVVFSLLGMDPRAAFPIMMGSGAFVAMIAGVRFVSAGRLQRRAALGLAAGGIPGVVVAVWLVESLARCVTMARPGRGCLRVDHAVESRDPQRRREAILHLDHDDGPDDPTRRRNLSPPQLVTGWLRIG